MTRTIYHLSKKKRNKKKTSPRNFCGVDLLRLVMLIASLSTNWTFLLDGWSTGLVIVSMLSAPAEIDPSVTNILTDCWLFYWLTSLALWRLRLEWGSELCYPVPPVRQLLPDGPDSSDNCGSAPNAPPVCSVACSFDRSSCTWMVSPTLEKQLQFRENIFTRRKGHSSTYTSWQ